MPPRTLDDAARATLAANLVAARERAQFKYQGPAAKAAGVSVNRLSLWETAVEAPGVEGLLRLAVAYNCSVDDFLGGVDELYDEIIERRIPVDVRRHYRAQIDRFLMEHKTGLARLADEAIEPKTTEPPAALPKAHGKSVRSRAHRKSPKKK